MNGPPMGKIWLKDYPTPGELENCGTCALYRQSLGFTRLRPEVIGDDLLGFWQKYHMQHVPWTEVVGGVVSMTFSIGSVETREKTDERS